MTKIKPSFTFALFFILCCISTFFIQNRAIVKAEETPQDYFTCYLMTDSKTEEEYLVVKLK